MPSLSLKQSVSPSASVRPSPTLRVSGGREECDGDPIESAPKIAANPRQTQRHRRLGRHAFASPGKGWDRRRSHSQKTHSLSDGGGRHADFASGKVGTEERPELISSTVFRKNAGSTQHTTERYRELPLRSPFFWPCPDGPRAWTTKSDLISPKEAQNAAIAAEGRRRSRSSPTWDHDTFNLIARNGAGLPHPFTLPIVVKCPLN